MRTQILISLLCGMLPFSCTFLVGFDENITPEDCVNGLDDDGDGHADCSDQDCWNLPACLGQYEDCYNGIDDDENGLIDCEDPACAGDPSCIVNSPLCNRVSGDPSLWMYSDVYPSSPGGICPDINQQCRIDLTFSDGVPRCVLAEAYLEFGDPCDNDLQCRSGMVCTYSERMNPELSRNVCMPLCSGIMNIGCPDDLECFRRLADIWDQNQPGGALNVSVFSCDLPVCQVLGFNSTQCGNLETCYPDPDMMGQGHCARLGAHGNGESCDSESDCLPRHTCFRTGEGQEPSCRKVCKTTEDCTDIGPVSFTCVKEPYWTTYGVCVSFDGGR